MTRTNEDKHSNRLILKIKHKRLDLIVLFHVFKKILNLTTNKYELEPKIINSLVLKSLNKKILKFFIIYGIYFDNTTEGLFLISSDFLPDIEMNIEYSDLTLIISNWSKTAYRLIKKYVDIQLKNQFFIRYIYEINKVNSYHLYKSASPKQLLGNALAYFNRQGYNINNDFFKTKTYDECLEYFKTKNTTWSFDGLLIKLLIECRNQASSIYYLDLQDLLLNSIFPEDTCNHYHETT